MWVVVARCCGGVDLGKVQPWPIQTLSMARLMPADEEGGCQEGAYFVKKVALVLSPLGRVGFQ